MAGIGVDVGFRLDIGDDEGGNVAVGVGNGVGVGVGKLPAESTLASQISLA